MHNMGQEFNAKTYGIRPSRTFREAALFYIQEKQHKRSIGEDIKRLNELDRYIGCLQLPQVHNGTLKKLIDDKKSRGNKSKTINLSLEVVRHILRLASSEWVDENGLTWLLTPPKIRMLPTSDSEIREPISWQQQAKLFKELPIHLREMATYKVNVGCREQEVCKLQWDWEYYIPELNASVFVIPAEIHKNGLSRYHFLNREAQAVVERQRGKHETHVFAFKKPVKRMNNTAWKKACKRAGFHIGVHVLKHTLGERLRAVGVSSDDAKDILGHKKSDITAHYSKARIENLIAAVNKVCDDKARHQTITMVKGNSRKTHANDILCGNLIRLKAL